MNLRLLAPKAPRNLPKEEGDVSESAMRRTKFPEECNIQRRWKKTKGERKEKEKIMMRKKRTSW